VVAATISVDFSEELTRLHEAAGLGYVAAPVLGRPDVAARGELNILAAGRFESVERVRPLLDVLGKKVWDMGEVPKRANAAKLAANMMIAMVIESMAEAVAITEANGLSREIFFDLILNALFGGRSYQTYSSNIAQRRFEPGFKARLGLKDLQLATAAAEACGGQLPMLDAVRGQMIKADDAGWGERDWSVMSEILLGDTSGERR
jgi:3-hydroxyisobutyrate dehydrogenase-like beta-hydroxyacid dehydrogenase